MKTSSSLAIHLSETMASSMAIKNQYTFPDKADVITKFFSGIITKTTTSPIAEIAKQIQRNQFDLVTIVTQAINQSKFRFESFPSVKKTEAVNKKSILSNLTVTIEGQFFFKDTLILAVNAGSKHGRFLKMLLTYKDNFVSDEEFRSQIDLSDNKKGIGYIRRDLKKYLMLSGFEINILRIRKFGHKLVSICKIAN